MRILIIFLFFIQFTFGQKDFKTDCNTIFICIDSTSYNAIFSNSFLRDTIFLCRAQTTSTNNDQYSGKYFIGKSATIEFLQPQKENKIGNNLDDFGIEFKTRKLGDISRVLKLAEKNKIEVDTLTNFLKEDGINLKWYQELSIKKNYFDLSVLEYQKEYLNYLDFSETEIANEMSYEAFNNHLSNGRKYPRQFNKIKSITISINKTNLKLLEKYCLLNHLIKGEKYFYNEDIRINYSISKSFEKTKIKNIEIDLLENQKEQNIEISKKIKFELNGKIGQLIFYN